MSTEHKVKSTWHGRRRFRAHCVCGWQLRGQDRASLDVAAVRHVEAAS